MVQFNNSVVLKLEIKVCCNSMSFVISFIYLLFFHEAAPVAANPRKLQCGNIFVPQFPIRKVFHRGHVYLQQKASPLHSL